MAANDGNARVSLRLQINLLLAGVIVVFAVVVLSFELVDTRRSVREETSMSPHAHGTAMDLLQRSPKESHGDVIAQLIEYGALYKMMLAGAVHRAVPSTAAAPAGQSDADSRRGDQPAAPGNGREALTTYPMSEVMSAFDFTQKPNN